MTDEPLVMLCPGTWVRPSRVTRIDAYPGDPEKRGGFGNRIIAPATKPRVIIRFSNDMQTSWRFNTYKEAEEGADRMGALINGKAAPADQAGAEGTSP